MMTMKIYWKKIFYVIQLLTEILFYFEIRFLILLALYFSIWISHSHPKWFYFDSYFLSPEDDTIWNYEVINKHLKKEVLVV